MKDLLKADFYRLFKNKLTLIVFIIGFALPILMALLIFGVNKLLISEFFAMYDTTEGVENVVLTSRQFIVSALSPMQNFGIAVPIFSSIYICQDMMTGSMRNKLIYGHKRSDVYTSHLIVSIVFNVSLILVYFLSTVLFTSLFLPYGVEFNTNEFKSILLIFMYGIICYVFIATLSTMFAFLFRNLAPTIILTIVSLYGLSLAVFFNIIIDMDYLCWVPLVSSSEVTTNALAMAYGEMGLNTYHYLAGIGSCIIFGMLFSFLGFLRFKKCDLK